MTRLLVPVTPPVGTQSNHEGCVRLLMRFLREENEMNT